MDTFQLPYFISVVHQIVIILNPIRFLFRKNKFLVEEHYIFRSSRPEVFWKKGVIRNFAKFTGKHLCQSSFLNKVADLRSATY